MARIRSTDTKPEEISCPYFTEQEKNVVIAFSGEITPANEYQLVGHPELSRTSIKIFGQDKALAKIDTIYTEYSTLTDITDTMSTRMALALPQSVRTETDSINIRVIAERFTEKKFIVPLHVLNVPEGVYLRLFPNEVEVSVRVGISHFAQVQATDIKAVCIYTSERSDKLDVELRYSNPYITSAWVYPGVIEFMVEQ